MGQKTVLLVEDEAGLAEVLSYRLQREGFQVFVARTGTDALQQAQKGLPDVVVLDVMLPEMNGLEVCKRLKADPATARIPILMLTARSGEYDEVMGLRAGADDYVVKPFRMLPLIERVKRLASKGMSEPLAGEATLDRIQLFGIVADRTRHRVTVGGREAPLTATEFRILWTLMRRPGVTYTRHELLDLCVGELTITSERTIDAHVKSIRSKLGDNYRDCVETVWGVGYRFKAPS
jgi:DNA-binding response OmpR family regulator